MKLSDKVMDLHVNNRNHATKRRNSSRILNLEPTVMVYSAKLTLRPYPS